MTVRSTPATEYEARYDKQVRVEKKAWTALKDDLAKELGLTTLSWVQMMEVVLKKMQAMIAEDRAKRAAGAEAPSKPKVVHFTKGPDTPKKRPKMPHGVPPPLPVLPPPPPPKAVGGEPRGWKHDVNFTAEKPPTAPATATAKAESVAATAAKPKKAKGKRGRRKKRG